MKKNVNKSELIRAVVASNPNMKASAIVAQLKKDGVTVSAPLVYQTLKNYGAPKAPGKKRGRKPGVKNASTVAANTNDLFASLQSFVTAAGGLDKAISILSVFKS
jgi:arginine repressor